METKSIRVRIYGAEYPLRVEDEYLIQDSASKLDRKMSEIHQQNPDQPPLTLAVLSALNFLEDLAREQNEKATIVQELEREIRSMSQLLEGSLRS